MRQLRQSGWVPHPSKPLPPVQQRGNRLPGVPLPWDSQRNLLHQGGRWPEQWYGPLPLRHSDKYALITKVYLFRSNLAIRRFDKTQLIDLGKNTKRRNQTDVGSFRRFNGTQTTVMGVVNITHFKTGTLTRQTTRPQGRHTTLVGHLCQGIGLVHELRKRIGTKETIDH